MTMASVFFGPTLEDAFDATAIDPNFDGDTIRIPMVTNTYTPDANTHDQFADVTNEVSNSGSYTSPGAALGSQTWATSGGFTTLDGADTSYTTFTGTARGAVPFDDTLTGDPLICAVTFGSDFTSTAGTFLITWAAAGIVAFDIIP
jgi:hypothetical protein